jgi:endonuclease/exonuclease/phosphatase family metal-dependent hydrolase
MKTEKWYWIYIFLILGNLSYSQNLKLMSYNIRLDVASDGLNAWPVRKDFFGSQIQFYEPDIMGVQEAMPNQVLDLEQMLPQYNQVGIGREGKGKGESSNIFYKNEKLEIVETNTFWLSDTPDSISKGWDAACHRVCTYALFREIDSNTLFWVFNTHLDHVGIEARVKAIALILSKIDQLNRIDYIFISKNAKFEVKKYAVLTDSKNLRYPSDHFPVYVEIK